ncbi:MAG: HTTM domain-containing protein [Planctomycetota bacterium]|nr:HTTM domain-containing protein [Planctomycetota bacterium]
MKSLLLGRESPRPVAVLRIVLCSILLVDALRHWPYCVELYSNVGHFSPLPEISESLLAAFSPAQAVIIHTLYVFFLITSLAGWWTRASLAAVGSILVVLSLIDYPLTLRKDTVISIHLLLLLALTRCDAVWSLDRRFAMQRCLNSGHALSTPLSPELSRRLMHVLLLSIYWGAAITKFHMPDFFNGELLEFSLLDERWGRPVIGHRLADFPRLLAIMGVATTMLEVCLPVLLFGRRTRRIGLLLAASFHIGLFLTMRLDGFSPVMLAALVSFTNEDDLQRLTAMNRISGSGEIREWTWLRTLARQSVNGGWFVIVGALFAVFGLAWQSSTDTYGAFGNRPESGFERLSHAELLSITTDHYPPVHQYFHAIHLGDSTANRRALGKTTRFLPGETVVVAARLMLPHPDLQLRCVLLTRDNVVWSHDRQVPATDSHFFLGVTLDEALPAGEYRIQIDARNPLSQSPNMLETVCSAAFVVTNR